MGNTVREGIVIGEFDTAARGMIMGLSPGQRLGLSPGPEISRVTLFSAQGLGLMLTRVFSPPPIRPFDVRGLYKLEETYDNTHMFIGLEEAQRLFHMSEYLEKLTEDFCWGFLNAVIARRLPNWPSVLG